MKFFKSMLFIIALLNLNAIHAKNIGPSINKPSTQIQPTPTVVIKQPTVQQPIKQESYKDLVAYVKKANNAWDNTRGMLRSDFITAVVQKARASHLDPLQLEALLQTARDIHGIFSGNQNKDISILQAVDNQIAAAIKQK